MHRLIVGGWIVSLFQILSAIQYAPFETTLDPSECALILNQHSEANLLSGVLQYGSAPTCVTYDAVNQAYLDARKRIKIQIPNGEQWAPDQVATVGELLQDISEQLAKTYGMSGDDIEKGLPFIDTSKTLIREVCPAYLSDVTCHAGKYRRLDGLCNNLANPSWGATNTPFTRLMPPQYTDLMSHPRESIYGTSLPLPRVVSRTIHPDEGFHDHAGTVMIVAWGQFMDHDFTLTATPLDRFTRNEPEECCNRPPHLKHPYCMDLVIPEDDYFYSKLGVKCQDFVRSFPSVRPGCRLGSKTPFNTLTGVIDGNTVYGVTDEFGRHLRQGELGLLRMNPVFSEYGLKDLLPLKLDYPDEGCARFNGSEYCFEAGEIRVNEQLVLSCMHTLMARQHNTVARALAKVNPHWDDETLYQEARRVVIAQIQHITFNEFLPIVLGKEVMHKFGIMLEKQGYWDGYDETVNPNIIDAFSAAAFRFGHSLLPTAVERWSKAHKFIASKRLSDLIRRPYDLYRAGVLDEYLMGLMNQVAQAMDDSITQEVTNNLFKKKGNNFGFDLVAFNMQRGREFGVPGYMYFRKFCGLPIAENFDELFDSMPNSTVARYRSIFESTWDVDLWSGGVSEKPLPGSLLGPTFACIIATQMNYLRRGDRFWYELPNQPSSFTPEQLEEIKKTKLARIICDNTDLIDTIQVYPMVLPDYEINPRVACKSGVLPKIDWSKWAEYGSPSDQAPTIDVSEEQEDEVEGENESEELEGDEEITTDYDEGTEHEETPEDEEVVGEDEDETEDGRRGEEQTQSDDDKVPEQEPPKKQSEAVVIPKKPSQSFNNMTKAVFMKTLNRTVVQLPLALALGVDFTRGKRNKTANKFLPKESITISATARPIPALISATTQMTVTNSKVSPLKFHSKRNQTILAGKKWGASGNKLMKDEKTSEKASIRNKRDIAYRAEADFSSSAPGSDNSGPSPTAEADHEYDSDYDAAKDRDGSSYDDREPDAYDIHGYKGQTDPPNKMDQPAYLVAKGEAEHQDTEMVSKKPVSFKSKKKKKKNKRKNRGRATSSVSISMNGEHHHHHFYDDLKETHENPPDSYVHSPHFLIPKLPPEIYKKFPGKHKHFHHIRRPGDPPIAIPDDEDDEDFDPDTLTDKDHEEAYKTYDEDVNVNGEDDDDGESPPNAESEGESPTEATRSVKTSRPRSKTPKPLKRPNRKKTKRPTMSGMEVSSMKSKKSKEEVDRIFDTVERAMNDPALNVPMPPSNRFERLWNVVYRPRQ